MCYIVSSQVRILETHKQNVIHNDTYKHLFSKSNKQNLFIFSCFSDFVACSTSLYPQIGIYILGLESNGNLKFCLETYVTHINTFLNIATLE